MVSNFCRLRLKLLSGNSSLPADSTDSSLSSSSSSLLEKNLSESKQSIEFARRLDNRVLKVGQNNAKDRFFC